MQASLQLRQVSFRALLIVLATALLVLALAAGLWLRGLAPSVSATSGGSITVSASGSTFGDRTHRSGIQY